MMLDESNRRYFAYARHALVSALQMLRVRDSATVLIPEFICRDVLASLHAVGAEPHFYAIDDQLQPQAGQTLPPAAALMVVNYFGFPADITRARSLMASPPAPIIEDNAHGWLSADQHGTPLGSRTQVGITSIRKTIRLPDGAYLQWNAGDTLDIGTLEPQLPPRTTSLSLSFRLRHSVAQLDAHSPIALMPIARNAVRLIRRTSGRSAIEQHPTDEWQLPAARSAHHESMRIIKQVDHVAEVVRRRELFLRCSTFADKFAIERPFVDLPLHVSPQGFPFFGDTAHVGAFCRMVRRSRCGEVIRWPALPSRSSLPTSSRLRTLHLVNFLV